MVPIVGRVVSRQLDAITVDMIDLTDTFAMDILDHDLRPDLVPERHDCRALRITRRAGVTPAHRIWIS